MKQYKFPFLLLLVTSLGYFVDAFDLVVFSVVRRSCILDLRLATGEAGIKTIGILLENCQSWGLLAGGIVWGVFGDKLGRMKVLYASIAFYSISNILSGLLSPGMDYGLQLLCALRFLCGLGLAGELGASVTLISETMPAEKRGLGTMFLAGFGVLGCATAALVGAYTAIQWHWILIVAGVAGLLLLFFRAGVFESELFARSRTASVSKGNILNIFTSWERAKRFLCCILVGLPVYFVVGLPIKFSANFGAAFNISGVSVPLSIMMCYLFLSVGDFICNYASQILKSRKKVFYFFNSLNLIVVLVFVLVPPHNSWQYHFIYCPLLGFSVGYWSLIVTNAAEQAGTNLRSTFATTIPNFIRSSFIVISIGFTALEKWTSTIAAAGIIGIACSCIALFATHQLNETFGKNLDYYEFE
jgi:putative MFS transporter